MPLDLIEVVKNYSGFNKTSHNEKIKFFGWFLHTQKGHDTITQASIKSCYEQLHLDKPTNVTSHFTSLSSKKPKELIKKGSGYFLPMHIRDQFSESYGMKPPEVNPKTEQVLPISVIEGTRDYYKKIILQVNQCYETNCFDACSVMIRKFIEILIIDVYEQNGRANEIRDGNNFYMLSGLIATILADTNFNLGRETVKHLPDIKSLGDRAAHNRRYLAIKADIDKLIQPLRVIADELLHLAKFK